VLKKRYGGVISMADERIPPEGERAHSLWCRLGLHERQYLGGRDVRVIERTPLNYTLVEREVVTQCVYCGSIKRRYVLLWRTPNE
jgi:hypothetical protein